MYPFLLLFDLCFFQVFQEKKRKKKSNLWSVDRRRLLFSTIVSILAID